MTTLESPVDIDAAADRLNVSPDALRAVVDNYEHHREHCQYPDDERPLIEEIHAYSRAIAVVTLSRQLQHVGGGAEPFALVDFDGHVFPYHPGDADVLRTHNEQLPETEPLP
jgi:hypothetical protein